ncbi:hypothetical protein CC80DRAFT_507084 [Byssothecium circinans]|uniref:Uncharacterized protein n=1 Tax=Byssothecium circinans TaxID=147558 RepID=A0A6A5TPF7_9PLEO|nr:hypothetical protein CC80DRAFT_507084 [Byssothecium circinans]
MLRLWRKARLELQDAVDNLNEQVIADKAWESKNEAKAGYCKHTYSAQEVMKLFQESYKYPSGPSRPSPQHNVPKRIREKKDRPIRRGRNHPRGPAESPLKGGERWACGLSLRSTESCVHSGHWVSQVSEGHLNTSFMTDPMYSFEQCKVLFTNSIKALFACDDVMPKLRRLHRDACA